METIRVQLLRAGARVPSRATEGSSGFDLYACTGGAEIEVTQVPVLIPTGIAIEAPPGLDVQVRPRSGLARLGVIAAFGTIDADYRGEVLVTLYTTSAGIRHVVRDGDRIAQLVVSRLEPVRFEVADALAATARGAAGHGSTGR
ncbi:MAG: dUTP diphosphatase [Chloroflexota bacterium]|jgi:dUTP pyrophosphatase|nr:dUTP diphosphatase [Dehalococcoidia bacterium]MDW8046649.1 dUTP diphosphatase [Chloroflexota bacterium]